MSEQSILSAQSGSVLTLTLNRPQNLNSFNALMHAELLAALNAAADDPEVRAIVLTGAGRGFCAGQDLSDPAVAPNPDSPPDVGNVVATTWTPLVRRLRSMPVPVICAVNGVAAGAGANTALACDLVIAARSASFVQAFSKIGLIPDAGGSWSLMHLVGRAKALGLAMLSDKLRAEEAERIGLIWQVVDDEALLESAQTIAQKLALLPVKALAATRGLLDNASGLSFEGALVEEARVQGELCREHDFSEGVAAFAEKRLPLFKDR